jgi:hypothetical protein
MMSGFFNTGVLGAIPHFAGEDSGFLNIGTFLAGFLNLGRL